jgi:hypothetical protein
MKYLEMSTDIALGLKPNVRVTQQSVHNIQLSQNIMPNGSPDAPMPYIHLDALFTNVNTTRS